MYEYCAKWIMWMELKSTHRWLIHIKINTQTLVKGNKAKTNLKAAILSKKIDASGGIQCSRLKLHHLIYWSSSAGWVQISYIYKWKALKCKPSAQLHEQVWLEVKPTQVDTPRMRASAPPDTACVSSYALFPHTKWPTAVSRTVTLRRKFTCQLQWDVFWPSQPRYAKSHEWLCGSIPVFPAVSFFRNTASQTVFFRDRACSWKNSLIYETRRSGYLFYVCVC